MTDTYEYDAFGNLRNKTGTTPNEMLYRGEQWDSDLGLYYLRARWYNPQSGRFMSRDPNKGNIKVPATLHKYLYANGDPVNLADPSGRDALLEFYLVTYVVVQRALIAIPPVAIATCANLKLVDLLLKEYSRLNVAVTGELETKPNDLHALVEQALQYCEAVVPEE